MDISDSSLTPHTNSLVKFLDCDHSLPGGVNILSEFHDLRLYGRDILRVCLNRINHRLQYARCLSHIGQVTSRIDCPTLLAHLMRASYSAFRALNRALNSFAFCKSVARGSDFMLQIPSTLLTSGYFASTILLELSRRELASVRSALKLQTR